MTSILLSTLAAFAGETDVEYTILSEVITFNNLDFRPLDESSDQAIMDSDDRTTYAFLSVGAELDHKISDGLAVNFDLSHRALWGGDELGSVNAYGGFVYVRALHMDWAPKGALPVDDEEEGSVLRVRVGRQRLTLGGGQTNDFVYDDIADGIRVDVPFGEVGHLELVPLSIVSQAGDVANTNQGDMKPGSGTSLYNFRGDNLTTRGGGILVLDGLVEGLDVRAHLFYTDMSARGSGADISYDGMLGNFADNDYTGNYGVRGTYSAGAVVASAEFAGSFGVDRKELIVTDASTTGFAGGGLVEVDTSDADAGEAGVRVGLQGWYAQGGAYAQDGIIYSHGYVGMKGDQMGGLVADRLMGWHPSAYSDDIGVDHDVHDRDRKSGSLMGHGGFAYVAGDASEFGVDGWYMADTGFSYVDFANVDALMPPYGYAREEFAAQERAGKGLGIEVDGHVRVQANEKLSFSAVGGLLSPGAFYKINVARVAGNGDDTQLGPNAAGLVAPAWVLAIGTELKW